MRIAHINLSPPGNGGIERLLVNFMDSGKEYGMDVEICVLGSLNEFAQNLIVQGNRITAFNRKENSFDWSLFIRLARHLRSNKFDIVHIHGNTGLIFGAIAAMLAHRCATVYTCHFSESNHSRLKHAFLGILLRSIKSKVAVSNAAKKILTDKYHQSSKDIKVIHNAVDVAHFSHSSADADSILKIGFCGVLRPEKQVPLLIRSFANLINEGLKVQLSIVGDGSEMEHCIALTKELQIGDQVVFHGYQKDIRNFVKNIDIFCLPSSQEAMPVALLEAMAMGCCVVGSNVGGIPEVIEHEKSGFLVTAGNTAELTDTLRRLVSDPCLRRNMGKAARDCVIQRFNLDLMLRNYAELYHQII